MTNQRDHSGGFAVVLADDPSSGLWFRTFQAAAEFTGTDRRYRIIRLSDASGSLSGCGLRRGPKARGEGGRP
jgi:hypothetical protein